MVGKGVLLECLDHPDVKEVLSIGRRSLGMDHPKLQELIHDDFSSFESVANQLHGYDACFACMGVSAAGMKEEKYKKLTYDFTMALAGVLVRQNQNMTFNYVSGVGTDSSEKGRQMWARVKGKTENDLLKLGFKKAFMFRPGLIVPLKGIVPSSKLYKFFITNLRWLIKIFKSIAPNSVVNTTDIGLAMINSALYGYEKNILEPKDILALSEIKKFN